MNDPHRLLNVAEAHIRRAGYYGFSFEEVAGDAGVSVDELAAHYPDKSDLATAVASRYVTRFFEVLGDPDDPDADPAELIETYITAHRNAIAQTDRMCLCGMLGAEIEVLPPPVAVETRRFFDRNIAWLTGVICRYTPSATREDCLTVAHDIMATVQGGMLLARSLGRTRVFEVVADELRARLLRMRERQNA